MDELIQILKDEGVEYETSKVLSNYTYLRTGGIAKLFINPHTREQLQFVIKLLAKFRIDYKVIGATSNLLFLDNASYNCILSTSALNKINLDLEKNKIVTDSGVMLSDLSRFALLNSINGFEGFEGIPGTTGGAIFMNAGAYGYVIKNVLHCVDILDEYGEERSVSVDDLGLHYRNSNFKNGKIKGVITRCYFNVEFGNQIEIEKNMEVYHAKRHKYQDFLYPNLGSLYSGLLYKELGKRDKIFWMYYLIFTFFNYKFKIFRRESPINRNWINNVFVKRFGVQFDIQPFSRKTINCLVNRGQGTHEMLNYIDKMNELTNNKIPIENEIVREF